jgi:REG-2-like HAD superfamily hydrolase
MNHPTLVFDVGGTLLHLDHSKMQQVYLQAAQERGTMLDRKRVGAVLETLEFELPSLAQKRTLSLENDFGKTFWEDFYAEGFRRLGVKADVSGVVAQIREQFMRGEFDVLFDDALPSLDALKAHHVPMGILSNFSPNLEDLLRKVGIHDYFGFFIVSSIAGVEKPDKQIFDLAVAAANRPRNEIIYVGDSVYHDMNGARAAGVGAVLMDRGNRYPDYSATRVQNLSDLVSYVEKEFSAVQA